MKSKSELNNFIKKNWEERKKAKDSGNELSEERLNELQRSINGYSAYKNIGSIYPLKSESYQPLTFEGEIVTEATSDELIQMEEVVFNVNLTDAQKWEYLQQIYHGIKKRIENS